MHVGIVIFLTDLCKCILEEENPKLIPLLTEQSYLARYKQKEIDLKHGLYQLIN